MFRKMTEQDLETVLAYEKELFPSSPWPEHEFLYEMHDNPFSHLEVYEEQGVILGYVDTWVMYEHGELANIAVAKHAQRKGVGQKLLDRCITVAEENGCESMSLEVRVSNAPAIGLYEKNDFITVSTRKRYYEDGEDAYLMVKGIGGWDNDTDSGN